MILTLSVVAAERGVLAAGSFGQHAMCFRWGRAAAHEVDDEPQLLQLVARVHALIALAPRRDDDAVAVLPFSNGRRFDAQHRRHRADRVDRLTARLRIVARAHATVSSDLHREQSVDPGQRQQAGHTARSVHDRQLRTSSDARVVYLDKEADAGGIDERQPRHSPTRHRQPRPPVGCARSGPSRSPVRPATSPPPRRTRSLSPPWRLPGGRLHKWFKVRHM